MVGGRVSIEEAVVIADGEVNICDLKEGNILIAHIMFILTDRFIIEDISADLRDQ